jgi:uncharacterized membrane protein YphA (DoxX/SURF4 family)
MANLAVFTTSQSYIISYWVTTLLIATVSLVGGVWDVLRTPYVRAVIEQLGYPSYFLIILGVWKVLAAVGVLLPGIPRLKEWAYAGLFFTFTGAIASHLAVGDAVETLVPPTICIGLLLASWVLRPSDRRDLAPD